MKMRWISFLVIILIGCSAEKLKEPVDDQVKPGLKEIKLLDQAVDYHAKSEYKSAVSVLDKVLLLNPENVNALYLIASCHYALGENQQSIRYLKKAARYRSDHLAGIYLLLGLNYEQLVEPRNALITYQFATAQLPKDHELLFRMGLMYSRLGEPELAAETHKKVIALKPDYAYSHLQLGLLYYQYDYKTPALLALSTYLFLKPGAKDDDYIRELLDELFKSGLLVDHKSNQISVEVNPEPKKDEGDFELADNVLSLSRAKILTDKVAYAELQIKQKQYVEVINVLTQVMKKNQDGSFCYDFYVPWYAGIQQQHLTRTLVAYILDNGSQPQVNKWLKNHAQEVKKLEAIRNDILK